MITTLKRLFLLAVVGLISAATPALALSADEKDAVRDDYPYYSPVIEDSCSVSATNGDTITVDGHKYSLPASHGFTGNEEAINADGTIGSGGHVAFSGLASSNKYGDGGQSIRDYAINMRWTFTAWYWDGGNTGIIDPSQLSWMRSGPRLVKVTNPRTHKSLITAILESGPAPWTGTNDTTSNNTPKFGWSQPQVGTPPDSSGYKGRVSGLTPKAIQALGAIQGSKNGQVGDDLIYAWADQENDKPGTVSSASTTSAASSAGCLNGAQVNVNGYAWPVGLGKTTADNGWGPPLGWPCAKICHHDGTPAFDIAHTDTVRKGLDSASIGVPEYAIYSGVLQKVGPYAGYSDCYQMQLFADDGYHYWYGHAGAKPDGKPPQSGQHVKAGDVISTIGPRKCTGNGSYPHLHIDRGYPKGADGGYPPSVCSGCRDPGFVDLMNGLFAGLTH